MCQSGTGSFSIFDQEDKKNKPREYIKQLKVYPLLKMFNIDVLKKRMLSLLYATRELNGVNDQVAKKLTVQHQMSKPILAVKCLRYP